MVVCGELPPHNMAILVSSLEKLKSASLSKVVEELGGSLKKVGYEYVTQCVWHDDKNPSLTINDDKGFCFCHVCREGGDVIKYVEQRKGLGFVDAANLAATILGVQLETDGISVEQQKKIQARRAESVKKLEAEQETYKTNLRDPRAGRVREILKSRGLSKEASKEFGLGYASSGFFSGRITIPITDYQNDIVGWTGRATKDQPGKYKNSADGELFHKKSLVFNEYRAKEAARLAGSLIFVEGHLDVVSMWQHGIANVVAMQGTGAPEPYILQRLARSASNFVLCFDGDEGGKKAVQQFISAAGKLAQQGEIQVNVVKLPQGQDPDELIRSEGVQAFHNLVASSIPWLDWVIDFWAADLDKTNSAHVTAVERELRVVIDGLQSNALRAHYIDKASRALSVDVKGAKKVAEDWGQREVEIGERQWVIRSKEKARTATERRMARIFVHKPEHRERLRPLMTTISHPPLAWLWDRLEELEQYCSSDLTPHSVMAVVAASEPHFLQQLRTIVQPNVTIDDSPGVLDHIAVIMGEATPSATHEPDTDQSSAF